MAIFSVLSLLNSALLNLLTFPSSFNTLLSIFNIQFQYSPMTILIFIQQPDSITKKRHNTFFDICLQFQKVFHFQMSLTFFCLCHHVTHVLGQISICPLDLMRNWQSFKENQIHVPDVSFLLELNLKFQEHPFYTSLLSSITTCQHTSKLSVPFQYTEVIFLEKLFSLYPGLPATYVSTN